MIWDRWIQRAQLCRFGNQNIYEIMGRDPITSPLTTEELTYFHRAIVYIVEQEFSPREQEYPSEVPEEFIED